VIFKRKNLLKLTLFTFLFLGLIISWLGFGDRGFIHLYRMEKERQDYIKKIRLLESANQDLMEQIERLRSDKDYIESVARRDLGLVRKDEYIYRFPKEKQQESMSGIVRGKISSY